MDELVEILRPHAEALECVAEVEHARVIARRGTSADQQLRVYTEGLERGLSDHDAQTEVVDWLIAQSVTPDGPGRRRSTGRAGRAGCVGRTILWPSRGGRLADRPVGDPGRDRRLGRGPR